MLGLFPLVAVWGSRELRGLEKELESHRGGGGGTSEDLAESPEVG